MNLFDCCKWPQGITKPWVAGNLQSGLTVKGIRGVTKPGVAGNLGTCLAAIDDFRMLLKRGYLATHKLD